MLMILAVVLVLPLLGLTFQVYDPALDGVNVLLSAVTGLASSLILGGAKRYTGILDTKIGKAVKPFQPGIVAGLAMLLPFASNALGLSAIPDPVIFASAPVASLVGITAREIAVRAFGRKRAFGRELR